MRFSGILSNVRTRFAPDSFNLVVSVGLSGGDNHGSTRDRCRKIRGTEAGDGAGAGVNFYRFFPHGHREKITKGGGSVEAFNSKAGSGRGMKSVAAQPNN